MNEFEKYATRHCGINSLKLHDFRSQYAAYVSPTIIEERQLNVATMDVFSRLMMDRIIFLGAPIYDDAANIIQAQLLFLESADPEKDIQIYINSPGGSVTAGLGIYDTMQLVQPDVATICTGLAASMGAVLLPARVLECRRASSTSNSRGAGGYRYLVELYANGRRLELETNDAFWFRHDKDKGKVLQVWYNPNARCVERKSWETEFFAAVLAVIGAALLLIR